MAQAKGKPSTTETANEDVVIEDVTVEGNDDEAIEVSVEEMTETLDEALDEDGPGTAVVERTASPLPPATAEISQTERLLEMMIARDASMEKIERMVGLLEKERADQRRVEFQTELAKVQATFKPIPRSKLVKNQSGEELYRYGPIEEVVKGIGKKLNKAGFEYWFDEEDLGVQTFETEEGEKKQLKRMRRYWFVLEGFGHERRNYVDLPEKVTQDTGRMKLNEAQQRGSSKSYGRRLAMVDGLGIVFEGQDDDALSLTVGEVMGALPELVKIQTAKTPDELRAAYQAAYKKASDDRTKAIVIAAKNERKIALGIDVEGRV